MADAPTYARILRSFWSDPKIKRKLTRDQKHLLLYLFTSPHGNLAGLYYLPLTYAEHEADLPRDQILAWMKGPLSPFVTYDEDTEEILVHRGARHNVGEDLKPKDNRLKAIERVLADTHSKALVAKFATLYAHWPLSITEGASKGASQGATKGLRKGLGKPEADTDTEAEADTTTGDKSPEAAPRDEKQPSEPGDAPPRQPSANGKRDLPDMAWGEFIGALKRAVEVHCWRQTQVPEVVVAGDASWTMDREISIAAALVREHELTGAEMLGAISVARETLGLPDKPITLRIFRGGKNGPGKFRDCLHEYRKREARRAQDDPGAPTSMASVLAGLGIPVVS